MAGMESSESMRADESDLQQPSLHEDESGATALETVMILGAIAIPSYFILMICLNLLTAHYRMLVTMNSLPFP